MSKDISSNVKALIAISPAVITGNGTTTGNIIDLADYNSCMFVLQSGTITDGTFTPSFEHGNEANLSDAAAVDAADLIGTMAAFAATDDNTVRKIGYKRTKRYVRIKGVQSGATSGGAFSATAILGTPLVAPVA